MKRLQNPRGDRVVTDTLPPPAKPLSDDLLYPEKTRIPDWQVLKEHLQYEGRLSNSHCLELIKAVTKITSHEPNLLILSSPITVVGDIHGQFYDFLKLLDLGGDPSKTQYVFLGDYVDRGCFSVEVLLLLYALKVCRPQGIWILRGNHECRQMTVFFNFREECIYKYGLSVYYAFVDSFDSFPLAAVVDNKFLCVHGGLSPDLQLLNQIGSIDRFHEPPRAGMFCDLLWADPVDDEKTDPRKLSNDSFLPNDVRGCSFFFGLEASTKFLRENRLLSIIRAHEAQLEGFKMHHVNPKSGFPTVITVFSAPNYCDCYNNKGAVLKFENNTLNIQQFNFSPHPYYLPNFMDVFTWSIPFVSEKVTEMLYALLTPCIEDIDKSSNNDEDSVDAVELPDSVARFLSTCASSHQNPTSSFLETGKETQSDQDERRNDSCSSTLTHQRAQALRKKVHSVARLLRIFRILRKQNEVIVQLKGVTPGHRIPVGALLKGEEGLVEELQRFSDMKRIDSINERRP